MAKTTNITKANKIVKAFDKIRKPNPWFYLKKDYENLNGKKGKNNKT